MGPRLIQVRYPEPNHPISALAHWWKRLSDEQFKVAKEERVYILGRLLALHRFCQEHTEVLPFFVKDLVHNEPGSDHQLGSIDARVADRSSPA